MSACAILIEAGPVMAVFGAARRLAAWAGVCPGNNESGGKRRSGRGRRGNKTLRAVLVECAHAAARTHNCQFRAYHKALMVRRGYKRAISATAHKLLRSVFAVLRDRRPYRDPDTDYEALLVQRNAPRWLRKLTATDTQWAAIRSIAEKMGCSSESLRRWVRQAERDQGRRAGLTTDERKRLKEQKREIRELRRANEILRKASAFFAQAELDRRPKIW